jgi:hypothetical protein
VYEALWPALQQAGLAVQVALVSENRAGEFRDDPAGRERWESAVARHKAGRAAKEQQQQQQQQAQGQAAGGAAGAAAASGAAGATAAPAKPAKEAAKPKTPPEQPKKRVVSGPECACCGVRFSGERQLAEHEQGKRHAVCASVAQSAAAPALAVECRQAAMDVAALRATFETYGALADVALSALNPLASPGFATSKADAAAGGPWFATLTYREAACAAKALGQKYLYVAGKRVYVEVVP